MSRWRRSISTVRRLRWRRIVLLATTGVLLGFAALLLTAVYGGLASKGWLGADFQTYERAAAHFLSTGNFYARDPSGTWYDGSTSGLPGPARYPPPALFLFIAFLFIPWPLWWAIPLGVTAYIVWWWRPALWSWPIMAGIVCTTAFSAYLCTGNTDLWVMLVIALATRWPATSWLLVAKPTQLVLTLPFIRSRGWWMGLLVAAAVSLPLLPLWLDWLRAVPLYQGQDGAPLIYGLAAWPVMLLPLLARIASSRKRDTSTDEAVSTDAGRLFFRRSVTRRSESVGV
jgi:hypothetical protein